MEIMRKRSYHLCEENVHNDSGSASAVHEHMELSLGQKRMCNGVSSYLLQVDHSSECTGISVREHPFSAMKRDTVAMETNQDATSFQPHIPANSMQSSRYVMTAGGDATHSSLSHHKENQLRKVCQRCLSGESGHITHILG